MTTQDTYNTQYRNTFAPVVGKLSPVLMGVLRRPEDTNAYTANDVVSNSTSATTLLEIPNAFRELGGSGYLVSFRLTTNKKSLTPRFRIHLFNAAPSTYAADNAEYVELFADTPTRLGYFDLGAMTTAKNTTLSDMSRAFDNDLRLPLVAASNSNSLFVGLETLDAFTPDSGQLFRASCILDLN